MLCVSVATKASFSAQKLKIEVLNVHEIFAPAHHIIFMEHIPNGELFDVLASQEPSVAGKPLAEGTSRRILRDVISGMAECYRFGVTHRDFATNLAFFALFFFGLTLIVTIGVCETSCFRGYLATEKPQRRLLA